MKNTQNGTGPPLAKQKGPGGWLQDNGLINGGFISHAYQQQLKTRTYFLFVPNWYMFIAWS